MILARYQKNNKGFTLVELMTVVAIIGALAALGVPQYRKMQRKAKRAEANMVLGVIASAEAAFYAEYNAYGTNMGGIGAEMDNDPQYYNVGFHGNAVQLAEFGGAVTASAAGGAGNPQNFPGYAGAQIRGPMCAANQFSSNSAAGGPQAIKTGISACYLPPAGAALAVVPAPNGTAAQDFDCQALVGPAVAPAGGGAAAPAGSGLGYVGQRPIFLALAAGNLYQSAAGANRADCVTINEQRTISLVQDGS